ncbi:Uncharacterized protein MLTONO_p0074 (plasmid) [Mesorhizobium loti]|nr:Uncharacterized protein MLTONO_p0074 [Mesorhizobium loti]
MLADEIGREHRKRRFNAVGFDLNVAVAAQGNAHVEIELSHRSGPPLSRDCSGRDLAIPNRPHLERDLRSAGTKSTRTRNRLLCTVLPLDTYDRRQVARVPSQTIAS